MFTAMFCNRLIAPSGCFISRDHACLAVVLLFGMTGSIFQIPAHAVDASPSATIRGLHFHRDSPSGARLEVTLDKPEVETECQQKDHELFITLKQATLPSHLAERQDVTNFATPVRSIEASARPPDTHLTVTLDSDDKIHCRHRHDDRHLTIHLENAADAKRHHRQAADAHDKRERKDDRLSLSFHKVDTSAALQKLADFAGINMVLSDQIDGTLTLQLKDVPWQQALETILESRGLGQSRRDGVLVIAPLEDIARQRQAHELARTTRDDYAPLHSRILQINYSRADTMARLLTSQSQQARQAPETETGESVDTASLPDQSLLSERGHVSVDERTNSLLVTDTRRRLARIKTLIKRLDVPIRQVLIKSRIVIAQRDFTRSLGVSQSVVGHSGQDGRGNPGNKSGGYSVQLPAANASGFLGTNIITDSFNLSLQLSAMEANNQGEIISSPKLITADGQPATIEQGQEIPYQRGTRGSNLGTSIEFKKAVLSLEATPKITPDDHVIMDLKVTQDSIGQQVPTAEGGSVPSIDTRHLTSQVVVKDGETVVLGGVFEQTNQNEVRSVPYISRIPVLGALFRARTRHKGKRELLIFVTPEIQHSADHRDSSDASDS